MTPQQAARRRLVGAVAGAAILGPTGYGARAASEPFTLVTFGDSILDCGHYNDRGIHPGQLLVRNDDNVFPSFRGRDLSSHREARLDHRARDGARIDDLPRQLRGMSVASPAVAIVTIGGNDLLGGLAADRGDGIRRFGERLDEFLRDLSIRPVLIGTVYDPTFGDDRRNFLAIEARLARSNLNRMNAVIGEVAARHGRLVDVHAHFLRGDPSWYTRTIEPSLKGASEVRAAFLPRVMEAAGVASRR
jgi:acyl-CoA thioesterase-1